MTARSSTIRFEDFRKTKTLTDLAIEGEFHPRHDLINPDCSEDLVAHFEIRSNPNWGSTNARNASGREVLSQGKLLGYYHKHESEKVYTIPTGAINDRGDSLVPCYECGVALKARW